MAQNEPAEAPSSRPAEGADFKHLTVDVLDQEHREPLTRAIHNVLSTEVAEITYAQIIDGLPLTSVAYDTSAGDLPEDHPLHDIHSELCPGMLDKARELRSELNLEILKFDSRVSFKDLSKSMFVAVANRHKS